MLEDMALKGEKFVHTYRIISLIFPSQIQHALRSVTRAYDVS